LACRQWSALARPRRHLPPVKVQITGGVQETHEEDSCSVPKLILVSRLQALLHQGQLKISRCRLPQRWSGSCRISVFNIRQPEISLSTRAKGGTTIRSWRLRSPAGEAPVVVSVTLA
jgi:hypothetical protein